MEQERRKKEIAEVYFSILENNPHPFDNSVSRKDVRSAADKIDIVKPHKKLDYKLKRIQSTVRQNHISKLQPLIGEAGAGKTHYYWILKDLENGAQSDSTETYRIIYVPSPPMPIRIPLHILTCLIDEQGEEIIANTAQNLINHFKKSDNDSKEILKSRMISHFGGVFSDIIRVFLQYGLDDTPKEIKDLCTRWLFGDSLEEAELNTLKTKNNIENDTDAFALLRIIDEFNGKLLIFFFDEMELIYRMHGSEAEIRLWEIIKKLFNESRNSVFITTCLLDVWDRVQSNLDQSIISRFEPEITLLPFQLEDANELYLKLMQQFWTTHFLKSLPNPFYPLNSHILEVIFTKSKGNPRHILKLIEQIFERIILQEVQPTDIMENADSLAVQAFFAAYDEKISMQHEYVPTQEDFIRSNELRESETSKNNELLPPVLQNSLKKARLVVEEEVYFVDITPTAIISSIKSLFDTIQTHETEIGQNISSIEINYQFQIQGIQKEVPLMIELEPNSQIGFQIPLIKNFKNTSKAKAYFSFMESTSFINRGKFQKMVLILPPNLILSNSSLTQELEDFKEELIIIELDEAEAKHIVEYGQPSYYPKLVALPKIQDLLRFCFPDFSSQILPKLVEIYGSHRSDLKQKAKSVKIDNLADFLLKINE